MRIVTVKMPELYVRMLGELVERGVFASRSEALRTAVLIMFTVANASACRDLLRAVEILRAARRPPPPVQPPPPPPRPVRAVGPAAGVDGDGR